jgi:hypothetical protein
MEAATSAAQNPPSISDGCWRATADEDDNGHYERDHARLN